MRDENCGLVQSFRPLLLRVGYHPCCTCVAFKWPWEKDAPVFCIDL